MRLDMQIAVFYDDLSNMFENKSVASDEVQIADVFTLGVFKYPAHIGV